MNLEGILKIIFRRKSLNSILFVLVLAAIRELAAIGASEEIIEFCNKLQEDHVDSFIYYLAIFIEFIFAKGSYITLLILLLLLLIFLFAFLKFKESDSSMNQSIPEIDNYYEQQRQLLSIIKVETIVTSGRSSSSSFEAIGKHTFSDHFGWIKDKFIRKHSWSPEPKPKSELKNYCKSYFRAGSPLSDYIRFIKQILKQFEKHQSHKLIGQYCNLFNSSITYHERLLIFYYIYGYEDVEYMQLAKKYKLLERLDISDLIFQESYNLI